MRAERVRSSEIGVPSRDARNADLPPPTFGLPTKVAVVAVVAPDDVAYETARMYEAFRAVQNAPAEHRVFRDMADARRWLGLEPE